MKTVRLSVAAAVVGAVILIAVSARAHPAARWGYVFDRDGAIERARLFAGSLGLRTPRSQAYVVQHTDWKLDQYKSLHPEDAAARLLSPESVAVLLVSPSRKREIEIGLYPDGRIASWKREEAGAASWNMTSLRPAVDAAFHLIAGAEAGNYRLTTDGASTKDGLRFTWERASPGADFKPTIDVIARGGTVVHAETHVQFSREFDTQYSASRYATVWLPLGYFVLYFLMALTAGALYTVGSLRRSIDQRFVLAFAVVNTALVVAALFLGPGIDDAQVDQSAPGLSADSAFVGMAFQILFSFVLAGAVAGAGLFAAGRLRDKWLTLRLFLSRKLWSRQVGASITAGALWAPLLAAIPVLTAALIPNVGWEDHDHFNLFCLSPTMQMLAYPLHPTVVGFFGILYGFGFARISPKWLRRAAAIAAALVFFYGLEGMIVTPGAGAITSAALIIALLIAIFRQFDLLAVIAAETGRALLILAPVALLQPSAALHAIGWRLLAILAALLGTGLFMLWKAPQALDDTQKSLEPLRTKTQREELQAEFQVAQRAQREMLPSRPPALNGFSLAAACTPAREVGGDLYDFVPLSRDRLGIAVADVSGKGVPAALYMTLTKGLLAATAQDDLEMPRMLEELNRHLCNVGGKKTFVTMALGILNPRERTLEYARAGHNPAVWWKRSTRTTTLLNSSGLGLGITHSGVFGRTMDIKTIALESGDTVVFYSDGLTEAMNSKLEQFGEERLMRVVEKTEGMPAEKARDTILAEVQSFLGANHPQDDLTLVVLQVD